MQYELYAVTEPGRRLVALAEEHAADFATRADQHDREGSYPFENIKALKRSGYFTAAIPEDCGGLGVESVHDIVVASSRLARGDASTTIGVNMHLLGTIMLARHRRMALASGDHTRAAALGQTMQHLVAGNVLVAASISEPNQDLTRPKTTAQRNGSGWIINGTKIFSTMSPAASVLSVAATYEAPDGSERIGFASVPAGTAGVILNDDWDALGMRASGSGSVSYRDVHVPATALRDGFPTGAWSVGMLDRYLCSGLMHAAASLGIAESAYEQSVAQVSTRRTGRGERLAERPMSQVLTAENTLDLAAMRAVFDRAGALIDEYYAARPTTPGTLDELHGIFKEVQCAKTFVHEAAMRIVDRALTLSGGAGFMNKHPLSRLYRDVRAGPFMHPFGSSTAYEYIGKVTLGLDPSVN